MDKKYTTGQIRDELLKRNYSLLITNNELKKKIQALRKENKTFLSANLMLKNLINNS